MSEFNAREFGRLYRSLSDADKRAFIAELPEEEAYAIEQLWEVRARPEQLAPEGDWRFWLALAGRGWGKSLAITQWAQSQAMTRPKSRGMIVAATASDLRDVILNGPSGLLVQTPEHERPRWSPTYSRIDWPNGSMALLKSAEQPERFRGPGHHWAICDEFCFVAGTKIRTEFGLTDIEAIKVGDRAWTRSGLRSVVRCGQTQAMTEVCRVKTISGFELFGTPGHPLMVLEKGWVGIGDVCIGDKVLTWNDPPVLTNAISEIERIPQKQTVYNLEVEGVHEYYANDILVHNCAWRYPDAFDQMLLGLREGDDPRCAIATTPKPVKHLRELLKQPNVVVTHGSTYENRDNLAVSWFTDIIRKYEGTRLGQQELDGVLLENNLGALWRSDLIEAARYRDPSLVPEFERLLISIDPAVTANDESDETGIVIGGMARMAGVKHVFITDDLTVKASPQGWAQIAVDAYHDRMVDAIVAEVNNGGDLVAAIIHSIDPEVNVIQVRATRGKVSRAEPVVAYFEQGRVHMVGTFAMLETQMTEWTQGMKSPDRLDALVWLVTALMETEEERVTMRQGRAVFGSSRR